MYVTVSHMSCTVVVVFTVVDKDKRNYDFRENSVLASISGRSQYTPTFLDELIGCSAVARFNFSVRYTVASHLMPCACRCTRATFNRMRMVLFFFFFFLFLLFTYLFCSRQRSTVQKARFFRLDSTTIQKWGFFSTFLYFLLIVARFSCQILICII